MIISGGDEPDAVPTPAPDANELVRDTTARPRDRARITATLPRSRDLVFQSLVQASRASDCQILSSDRINHHLRFANTLPSGRLAEHDAFVFDAVGGAADIDMFSADPNDNDQFDPLYQCILKELSKFLLFASDIPQNQQAYRQPPPPPQPEPEPVHQPRRHYEEEDDDYEPRPRKPGKVTAMGGMLLGGGIFALLWVLLGFLFSMFLTCIWPGTYYAIVVGILAILKGSAMLGDRWRREKPGSLFIMLIILIVNLDLVNVAIGILGLVFMGDREVKAAYRRRV